jgi:hypothetical protein
MAVSARKALDAIHMSNQSWHVLTCRLSLAKDRLPVGHGLEIRRIVSPLTIFDLAAAGAAGFDTWAALSPLAPVSTAEIYSETTPETPPGYDALNRAWLLSALLVLRDCRRHFCPAVSRYSWNFIAGHQEQTKDVFREQLIAEGIHRAVYHSKRELPRFEGGLLDFHLDKMLAPSPAPDPVLDEDDAAWLRTHYERFNQLAQSEERFNFALQAACDWRFARDARAGIARIWAGIESVFAIKSELVYRVSQLSACVLTPRGPERIAAFKRIKKLYGTRSEAVHGAALDEASLNAALIDSYGLLRKLLLDAVERGSLRSEADHEMALLG